MEKDINTTGFNGGHLNVYELNKAFDACTVVKQNTSIDWGVSNCEAIDDRTRYKDVLNGWDIDNSEECSEEAKIFYKAASLNRWDTSKCGTPIAKNGSVKAYIKDGNINKNYIA